MAANKESKKFQEQIRNKILTYIEKREQFGNTSLSAIEQYNSASKHIDELDLHIDSFVKHNDGRMKSLIAKIDEEKNRADGLALFLLTSGLVTILIILFGIFTMIYKPLLNLSKIINEYKNGNVNVRANNSGLNEIKVVANNFNLMAENLKRQKEDQLSFIASIAHDLRNPLNAISIAIHLLMQDTDVKNIEILKIIHKQTNDLNRLVGDLLDTTRIEAGQLELEFSDTDIVTLLQNAVELFRNSSEIHNFVLKLPKSPVICHCDEVRLSQVINNLITNSIKYSPAGGCITVSMVKEEDRILFSVTDQGMGIEPNELENIFNPFQRTKATKSTIPGIGLGLSASKKIIEGHKGKIEVQSILNQGSTFQVTLPV